MAPAQPPHSAPQFSGISDHHACYFAHELTRHAAQGIDQLSASLFDAAVDLNPHQIEAALYFFRSPTVKGVLLADEVGLGKTIEASLILGQLWAEKRRRLLIVCPASLRKQWSLELREKFNLPSFILDARSYALDVKAGNPTPAYRDAIVIISYQYARKIEDQLRTIPWDVAVIDEAHKLRGCYRAKNRLGQSILRSLGGVRKVLLSATPLQNSLLELYGLSKLIDDDLFGDPKGIRNLDLEHPKLRLYREIKNVEKQLNDPSLTLNAFILSGTPFNDILNLGGKVTQADLEARHVLFMDTGKDAYLSALIAAVS